jgi:hypothetical protein
MTEYKLGERVISNKAQRKFGTVIGWTPSQTLVKWDTGDERWEYHKDICPKQVNKEKILENS